MTKNARIGADPIVMGLIVLSLPLIIGSAYILAKIHPLAGVLVVAGLMVCWILVIVHDASR